MKQHFLLRIFVSVSLLLYCSGPSAEECEDDDIISICFDSEPEYGTLQATLTINGENPQVVLNIYQGDDYQSGLLIISDTLSSQEVSYHLPLGEYSGTVLYHEGNDLILAVDGDLISSEQTGCDGDCWTVDDGHLDLTL
jgi:hypothetical protein